MTTYATPGPIGDVPPDPNKVESTWGNAIRDRLVNNFADETERDDFYSGVGGEVIGQVCHTGDHPGALGVWSGSSDALFHPPWNVAWGIMPGCAISVADPQGSFSGTPVDLDGTDVEFTTPGGRYIKHTVTTLLSNDSSDGSTIVQITDGTGTVKQIGRENFPGDAIGDGFYQTCSFHWIETPAAGTYARKLRGLTDGGAGAQQASATHPLQYTVEDAGPAADPS